MSDLALEQSGRAAVAVRGLPMRIGWRNLWRNKRRTWLTAGGIAFAVLLVVFSMCMQLGSYDMMMENATTFLSGHIQVQSLDYVDEDRFEHTIEDASLVQMKLERVDGVAVVAPRVQTFALASAGERSFGAQVMGVDREKEAIAVRFLSFIRQGRVFENDEEAIIGGLLARNLGITTGDEIVLLGSGREGGVAALVFRVSGIFETGISEVDRSLLWAPIAAVREGFGLGDEVHTFVIGTRDLGSSHQVAARLRAAVEADGLYVKPWEELLPEVKQSIEVDKIGGYLFYWIIMILVVFSVVNTFIMTVFERVREFGMLLAIGMRPGGIVSLVMWEAFFMWGLGVAVGLGLAAIVVGILADVGIYMGEAMEEMAAQLHMPDRLYPAWKLEALLMSPIVMLVGTQIAALLPCLRIRRLKPVEALRAP